MSINFTLLNNHETAKVIGKRLRSSRLNRDLSQADVAELAGVSESTIKRAESASGNITLLAFIAILRALDKLDQLDLFLPEPPPNPAQMVASKGKAKQRASRHRHASLPVATSHGTSLNFQWKED